MGAFEHFMALGIVMHGPHPRDFSAIVPHNRIVELRADGAVLARREQEQDPSEGSDPSCFHAQITISFQ